MINLEDWVDFKSVRHWVEKRGYINYWCIIPRGYYNINDIIEIDPEKLLRPDPRIVIRKEGGLEYYDLNYQHGDYTVIPDAIVERWTK